jgi:hypothetical protein
MRALVAAVAVLAACKGRDAPPRVEAVRDISLDPAPAPLAPQDVALPHEVRFRLLAAGAEPRAALRYHRAATEERTIATTIAIRSRVLTDGTWGPFADQPPVRQALAVRADGERLLLRVVEPPPAWHTLAGRRATARIDARGRASALAFDDLPGDDLPGGNIPGATGATSGEPDSPRDELWQQLLALAVPLPEEPIGIGARWEVRTDLRGGAALLTQHVTYELVAASADEWTIRVLARRIGEPQPASSDGLPPGTKAELVALFRELRGDVVLRPDDPLPRRGRLDIELRVHARFTPPRAPMRETATEDVGTIEIESR